MRQRPKCFRIWSGRWESNPTPFAANLLNSQRDFLFIGTTWDQKRGQLFNCFAVRSLDEMSIDVQCHSRVCMTELALCHFWRSATFEEQRCVCRKAWNPARLIFKASSNGQS